MKKLLKKNKAKPALRKKLEKKREVRKKQKDRSVKKLSLKEDLKKTKEDKVILNIAEPAQNLKSLIRDIFNLREARRQINFLGVDIKCISRHISEEFINKCIKRLNKINRIIDSKKLDHKKKKDFYFKYSKKYNHLIPHNFSFNDYDSFLINDKYKIKKEIRLLELLKSYRELKNKDFYIKGLINEEENNSVNLNDSVNMSVNNMEKSVEEETRVNISYSYYIKALSQTDYIFEVIGEESNEFLRIKNFLYRFSEKNMCAYPKLKLLQLYKLTNINNNFKDYENLFWYGCETPHLYSILRHGLRWPIELESNNIYHYGKGIMISHSPYSQLKYCLARNNIAYLFVCGNNGLRSKRVHHFHPNFPKDLNQKYDSICIKHKIKLINDEEDEDEEEKDEKDKNYDEYYDYVVYNLAKINLLYLAKIEIP